MDEDMDNYERFIPEDEDLIEGDDEDAIILDYYKMLQHDLN